MKNSGKEPISRIPVYIVLTLVCATWGGAFPTIKYLLDFMSPLQLVKLRYGIVAILFLGALLFRNKKEILTVFRMSPGRLVIASLFGVIGYNLSLAMGETQIPSGTAAIIVNISPIFTLILSIILLHEKAGLKKAAGLLISFSGLFILVQYGQVVRIDRTYYIYIFITLGAPISWAIYTVASRSLSIRYDSIIVTGLSMIIGALPLYIMLNGNDISIYKTLPLKAWLFVLYLSVLCTGAGFSGWVWALRRLPSSKVASFVYLIPVFSVIIAVVFLHEPVTAGMVLGAVLLLAGVYIVNRVKARAS